MRRKRADWRSRASPEVFDLVVGGESFIVMSLPSGTAAAATDELSAAERQVAHDAAEGLTNAAIANKRRRSPRTIANQLASIYRKLGVASRAELTARLLKRT